MTDYWADKPKLEAEIAALKAIKTMDALALYYQQKDGCKLHNPGVGKICVDCVDAALAAHDVAGRVNELERIVQKGFHADKELDEYVDGRIRALRGSK